MLPTHEARCHDVGCPERHQCLRWRDRETTDPHAVHVASMYPYDLPIAAECPHLLAPEEPQR